MPDVRCNPRAVVETRVTSRKLARLRTRCALAPIARSGCALAWTRVREAASIGERDVAVAAVGRADARREAER